MLIVKNFKGPGTMNPEKIKDTFIEAKGYVDEENDEVMKEAENNPDYEPDIKLNRKKPAIQKDNKHKKTGKGKVHKSK